ncbi:MAG TPA: NAD(P)H-dependent oxidoreductase [Gammaproteobacteria bacterium]|nr:NAD(P)H-dependent oxidoreductase [Gammaproteobacteria bacterium]
MGKHITVIQGHPDPAPTHFGHALADAYVRGAQQAGHEVMRIAVAPMNLPLLRDKDEWEKGPVPPPVRAAQQAIGRADHLVLVYPLWLGTMPAVLKGFLEQALRPGFAVGEPGSGKPWKRLLAGRSARIVVTMGMPALFYRWFFRAHSLKSLERNILGFCGVGPIRASLVGMVETADDRRRRRWLARMEALGRRAR